MMFFAGAQNMHREIERKFLVRNDGWRGKAEPVLFRQGYIARTVDRTVRIRVAGNQGMITVKVKVGPISRHEFEYEIPLHDANELLNSLAPVEIIEKYRYTFSECGHVWEIDEFLGANSGLVIAEVELQSEEEEVELPAWVGEEVSKISEYFNASLVQSPYGSWNHNEKQP